MKILSILVPAIIAASCLSPASLAEENPARTQSVEALQTGCQTSLETRTDATIRQVAEAFYNAVSENGACRPGDIFPADAQGLNEIRAKVRVSEQSLLPPASGACNSGPELCSAAEEARGAGGELDEALDARALALAVIPLRPVNALGDPVPPPATTFERLEVSRFDTDMFRIRILLAAVSDGCSPEAGARLRTLIRDEDAPGGLSGVPISEGEFDDIFDESAASADCIRAMSTGAEIYLHMVIAHAAYMATCSPSAAMRQIGQIA